jgi:hypothetical protein
MESKPVFELHKLREGFIVTSDQDIQLNDFYYLPRTNSIHQCNEDPTELNLEKHLGIAKVIAQQDQIDFSALSEEEQKEIGWYDMDNIIVPLSKEIVMDRNGNPDKTLVSFGREIFQKAQELLSDRRFTLEDVQLAFAKGAAYTTKPYPQNVQFENEYKQSLSQKSWKVEVEMELNLNGRNGLERASFIPKLTNGKIKILKLC